VSGRGGPKGYGRVALGVSALLSLVAGFIGAVISLFATAIIGVITVALGVLLLVQQRRPVGIAVVTCGVALLVGVGAYILLGVLQPDGAGTGDRVIPGER